MTLAFPLPTIPANALSRSFIADCANGIGYGMQWHKMLKQFAPAKARTVSPYQPLACYSALCDHIAAELFPLFSVAIDDLDVRDDRIEYAWDYGIPAEVCGLSYQDLSDGILRAPVSLVAAFVVKDYESDSLDEYSGALERGFHFSFKPPRGREWIAPWGDVNLLLDYISNNTGFAFLDWSHDAIVDGGDYPRWNIGEIKGLAADWKKAKPYWDRIVALINYLDHKKNLRLLADLLSGDKATLAQVTKPKGRTLAQIFR